MKLINNFLILGILASTNLIVQSKVTLRNDTKEAITVLFPSGNEESISAGGSVSNLGSFSKNASVKYKTSPKLAFRKIDLGANTKYFDSNTENITVNLIPSKLYGVVVGTIVKPTQQTGHA